MSIGVHHAYLMLNLYVYDSPMYLYTLQTQTRIESSGDTRATDTIGIVSSILVELHSNDSNALESSEGFEFRQFSVGSVNAFPFW